jgi:hypothetical protein
VIPVSALESEQTNQTEQTQPAPLAMVIPIGSLLRPTRVVLLR